MNSFCPAVSSYIPISLIKDCLNGHAWWERLRCLETITNILLKDRGKAAEYEKNLVI